MLFGDERHDDDADTEDDDRRVALRLHVCWVLCGLRRIPRTVMGA